MQSHCNYHNATSSFAHTSHLQMRLSRRAVLLRDATPGGAVPNVTSTDVINPIPVPKAEEEENGEVEVKHENSEEAPAGIVASAFASTE
jgi:hypothetical protein